MTKKAQAELFNKAHGIVQQARMVEGAIQFGSDDQGILKAKPLLLTLVKLTAQLELDLDELERSRQLKPF